MPAVPSYVSSDDGLGNEDIYNPWAKWYPVDTLQAADDLDYADDLALLLQTRYQMQEKTSAVADAQAGLGLKIHEGKNKVLKVNTVTDTPIAPEGEALDKLESFTYLGSIVGNTEGTV